MISTYGGRELKLGFIIYITELGTHCMQPPQVSCQIIISKSFIKLCMGYAHSLSSQLVSHSNSFHVKMTFGSQIKSSISNVLSIELEYASTFLPHTHQSASKTLFSCTRASAMTPWAWVSSPWHINIHIHENVKKTYSTAWTQHINLTLYGTEKSWERDGKALQKYPYSNLQIYGVCWQQQAPKPKQHSVWRSGARLMLCFCQHPLFR